jgi:carboxypeptidase T
MLGRRLKILYLNLVMAAIFGAIFPIFAEPAYLDTMLIVRIQFDKANIKDICDSLGFVPLFEGNGRYCDYGIAKGQLIQLVSSGLKYEIIPKKLLVPPTTTTSTEVDSIYHTFSEMQNLLFAWAADYPGIARVETIGTSQQENWPMYAVKISSNVNINEDKPVVYFDGTHHACEVMGLEICLALIDTLLTNYGIDPNITNLINTTEIWIVPLVNPDGHSAVMNNISHFYRKNGRDLNGNGILYEYSCNDWWTCSTEGIDLNRNYDWHWDAGGLTEPTSYYYRGAFPGSESENQAVTGLLRKIKPQLAISYHSYGEIVYYPWDLNGQVSPDHSALYAIAYGLAHHIHK